MQGGMDRLLTGSTRFLILSLIAASAAGACIVGYCALLALISARPADGLARLIAAAALAGGSLILIRYRDELVDDR